LKVPFQESCNAQRDDAQQVRTLRVEPKNDHRFTSPVERGGSSSVKRIPANPLIEIARHIAHDHPEHCGHNFISPVSSETSIGESGACSSFKS